MNTNLQTERFPAPLKIQKKAPASMRSIISQNILQTRFLDVFEGNWIKKKLREQISPTF